MSQATRIYSRRNSPTRSRPPRADSAAIRRFKGRLTGVKEKLTPPTLYDLVSRLSPRFRKNLTMCLGVTALLFAFYIYALSPTGFFAQREIAGMLEAKHAEIAELKEKNIQLGRDLSGLVSDKAKLEEIARNELNMMRPGETVYRKSNSDGLIAWRDPRQ